MLLLGVSPKPRPHLGVGGEIGIDLGGAFGRQATVQARVQLAFLDDAGPNRAGSDRAGSRTHVAVRGGWP
ncbi:MAG TPA: hypothetical protein VGP52_14020 [Stellaceae bacterium]|nr:hypothetical protein [Stellaceae bacterium]